MVRRGEIGINQVKRQWPHHVALPAAAVRGLANAGTVRGFAATQGAASLTYHLRSGDSEFVVFCFTTLEGAQAFHAHFGGELLPAPGSPRR